MPDSFTDSSPFPTICSASLWTYDGSKKLVLQLVLKLVAITALGNCHAFMMVIVSHSHVIVWCNPHNQLPISKINGEAGRSHKLWSHDIVLNDPQWFD